ncbi:hypothetical protein QBC47DRAFT_403479 [Echria macrotheca]|uniref:Uncharacterized protein n=1 Tax=Echria macrotheca TaxID=438768 RepID=A0AAJ0B9R7_9PEZI|nr:hypothetical protein QBC47DRAFT_403479 [Echria macrotheca]
MTFKLENVAFQLYTADGSDLLFAAVPDYLVGGRTYQPGDHISVAEVDYPKLFDAITERLGYEPSRTRPLRCSIAGWECRAEGGLLEYTMHKTIQHSEGIRRALWAISQTRIPGSMAQDRGLILELAPAAPADQRGETQEPRTVVGSQPSMDPTSSPPQPSPKARSGTKHRADQLSSDSGTVRASQLLTTVAEVAQQRTASQPIACPTSPRPPTGDHTLLVTKQRAKHETPQPGSRIPRMPPTTTSGGITGRMQHHRTAFRESATSGTAPRANGTTTWTPPTARAPVTPRRSSVPAEFIDDDSDEGAMMEGTKSRPYTLEDDDDSQDDEGGGQRPINTSSDRDVQMHGADVRPGEHGTADGGDQQADEDDVDDEDDEEHKADGLLGSVERSIRPSDDDKRHEMVCVFFGYNEERGKGSLRLFGTRKALEMFQLHAVWFSLHQLYGVRWTYNGTINAHDTGLGKTLMACATVAVLYTIGVYRHMIRVDREKHGPGGKAHNAKGVGAPCPSGNPLGIACPCVYGSLSSAIAKSIGDQPGRFLFLGPAASVKGSYEQAIEYFDVGEEAIAPRAGNQYYDNKTRFRGIRCRYIEGTTSKINGDEKDWLLADGLTQRWIDENRIGKKDISSKLDGHLDADGSEYVNLGGYKLQYSSGPPDPEPRGVLYFASTGGGGAMKDLGCDVFGRRIQIPKPGRSKTTRLIDLPWWQVWTAVVADEFHEAKSKGTRVMTAMRRFIRHSKPGKTKLLLLSGTPLSTELGKSLEGAVSACCPDEWGATKHHPRYKLSSKYLLEELSPWAKKKVAGKTTDKDDECMADLTRFCSMLMVRRVQGDTFRGKPLMDLPPGTLVTLRCRSNIPDRDAYHQYVNIVRDTFNERVQHWLETHPGEDEQAWRNAVKSTSYTAWTIASSLPGVTRKPGTYVRDYMTTSRTDRTGEQEGRQRLKYLTAEQRASSQLGLDCMDLTRGSGKIQALHMILKMAMNDSSKPEDKKLGGPYKKNVVVFSSRPSIVATLARYADLNYGRSWNIQVYSSQTKAAERGALIRETMTADIPIDSAKLPTLAYASIHSVGTGMNGLQGANYGVIFDIPFEESKVVQAIGRLRRFGNIHRCNLFMLLSADTEIETRVFGRHMERLAVFDAAQGSAADTGARYGCPTRKYPSALPNDITDI